MSKMKLTLKNNLCTKLIKISQVKLSINKLKTLIILAWVYLRPI